MRSRASDVVRGGAANAASWAPLGGALGDAVASEATASSASATAARLALAERLTRLAVEEVHAGHVDGDGHLAGELQADVRGELCDEVRARRDDALLARRYL